MDDLISRQAALDELEQERRRLSALKMYGAEHILVHHAVRTIERLPAVDAVPVVRCRDCKHFDLDHWETINGIPLIVAHEICTFWGGGCKTDADGHCFKAERREE